MSAYTPSELAVVALVVLALVVVLVGGHALGHRCPTVLARAIAWPALVLGTLGVERIVAREPAGVRMVALIVFALLVMKVIVVVEERARGMTPLRFSVWLGFAVAWLGMRPRLFATERAPLPDGRALVRRGAIRIAQGTALVIAARLVWLGTDSRLLASLLLLPGLSLVVHFGLCTVLAGAWRMRGVACEPLFRAPLRSESLGEFWAKRWNIAFSEMTAIAVYRPLADRFGRAPALIAAFALSGLLHEMAISVPVRAGYGLPLAYFLVHAALVLVERTMARASRPISGVLGRAWTCTCVVAPLPILFHEPFLAGVIWPVVGIPANH